MGNFFFWVAVAVVADVLLNELFQQPITKNVRGWLTQWRAGRRLTRATHEVQRESKRFDGLLDDVMKQAGVLGMAIPIDRSGYEPVAVKFSDGSTTYYFSDLQTYKSALRQRWLPAAAFLLGQNATDTNASPNGRTATPVALQASGRDALTQTVRYVPGDLGALGLVVRVAHSRTLAEAAIAHRHDAIRQGAIE